MSSKLYHVLHTKLEGGENPLIVSSWSTEAQATLAARHYAIDQNAQTSWTYEETDEEEKFMITFGHPIISEITIMHSAEAEKTASKVKLEPLMWGVFFRTKAIFDGTRDILMTDTFYPSLYQANKVARKEAWAHMRDYCKCIIRKDRYDEEDPTGRNCFVQHGPDERNIRSQRRCYSVTAKCGGWPEDEAAVLHVRPVRLAKEPPLKEKRKREDDDSKGSSSKKQREESDSRESPAEQVEVEDDGYTYYG
jgi:hypothetical protein